MSKFHPTSKTNPCPSCGDIKGNCRHQDAGEIILCMTANSNRKGEIVDGGYKVIDFSQDGLWAILKANDEQSSEEQKQQWASEQRQRREKSHREERQKLAQLLPISERNTQYRRIVASLGLNQKHRISALSEKRGLNTEEIDFAVSQDWLCSWQPGKEVKEVSPKLAGINPSRIKRTLLGVSGIGIAAIDSTGNITGFQIASDNREKFGKYIWLSSASKNGSGPHLPSGELPIFVWRHPEATEINETWLIEGGLKSLIPALKLWFRCGRKDIQVIGAAGANFSGSISAVCEALQGKVNLFPDAGSLTNAHILHQYKSITEALTSKAYSVSVAWWGQLEKGKNPDIDELENFDGIEYISPKEFFAITQQELAKNDDGRGQGFGKQEESRGYITKVRKSPEWLNWIDKNKYTPDITLNCNGDLVLSDELMNIENKNLLVNSGLGTNKTGEGLRLIKRLETTHNPFNGNTGIYTTILGYINSLLHQTIDRARGYEVEILHVQSDDDGKLLAKDTSSNVAGCVHSLPHFDGHFSGKAVMVDEIESVLTTLVTGSHLGSKHGEIIEMFFRAISASYGNIFLDGNMTDLSAKLIEQITGKQCVKVFNQGQIRRKKFEFIISGKKDKNGKIKIAANDPSPLIKMILDAIRNGKKAFVTTDSRIFGEGLAENAITITTDERSAKQLVDKIEREGYKVFIISKNTSGTDEGKAFLSNPGEYIAKNNIKLVIGTPSIGSGVSIQLPKNFEDHFDAQFTLFCGVLSTKQQKQLLARLRNNKLTHYVYCPIKSLVKDRNRPQQYSATEYLKEQDELQRLNRAISHEQIQRLLDLARSRVNPIFDRYSAELGALDNFEQDNLLECLSYSLESEGHEVNFVFLDPDEQAKGEMKEAKEKIKGREAVEFHKSTPFDSTLDADNQVKANPTPENHLRRSKTYFVKEIVPGIENKEVWEVEFVREFVIDDSPQYKVKAITREWLLRHPEIAFENHNIRLLRKLEKRYVISKELLPGDYGRLWALNELKFLERVVNAEKFTCKSPNIQELVKEYRERKDLQRLLKIEPPKDKVKDTTIQDLIRPMLEFLGMKTQEQGRIKDNGVARTAYKAFSAIEEKPRTAIYECLNDKFTKEHEKRELDKMLESHKIQEELTNQIKSHQSTVNTQEERTMSQQPIGSQWTEQDWFTEECLQDLSVLLDYCEDAEMLADLRTIAPASALRVASRRLPKQKKESIRQWVASA